MWEEQISSVGVDDTQQRRGRGVHYTLLTLAAGTIGGADIGMPRLRIEQEIG